MGNFNFFCGTMEDRNFCKHSLIFLLTSIFCLFLHFSKFHAESSMLICQFKRNNNKKISKTGFASCGYSYFRHQKIRFNDPQKMASA